MIPDKQTMLSEAQVVTVDAASTNNYYHGGKDVGKGEPLYLFCQVDEDVTAGGAATVTITLRKDNNSSMSSPTTVLTIVSAVPKATLIAGYEVFKIPLPIGLDEGYYDCYFTIATGPLLTGKFTIGVVKDLQTNYNQ